MSIKTDVLNFIKNHKGTSYVELESLFDKLGFEWRGNLETCSDVCDNVIYWYGWNKEALNILNSLQHDELIEKQPADLLVYLIDGKRLDLPLVKKFKEYKTPHWLPVVFNAI